MQRRPGAMMGAVTEDEVELTMAELRAVAGFAVACAAPALGAFEVVLPDDLRPRDALLAAQAFADGADRTRVLRDAAWAAQRAAREAADAGHPAAADAARAATAAAGAAFLHPLAKATQVKHILGSAAHAARAFELAAGDDPAIGDAHVARARRLASSTVVDVLGRYPAAPAGGGRVGELTRRLDVLLRRPEAPSSPRLVDAETVTWALQALVGLPVWASAHDDGVLTAHLGGRALDAAGGVGGEFVFLVPGGAWLARRDDDVLATSDDEAPVAASVVAALAGARVTAIALSVDGLALRVELDGATVLNVVPSPTRDLVAERWRLALPDGAAIVAGPGPLLRLVRAGEVDPSAPEADR